MFEPSPLMDTPLTDNLNRIHLWLRDETKPFERRTALTPNHAKVRDEAMSDAMLKLLKESH